MSAGLSAIELDILELLSEDAGLAIVDISAQMTPTIYCADNRRQRSGAIRSWLQVLERAGLVGRLDDKKPIAWTRTAAGTKAIGVKP